MADIHCEMRRTWQRQLQLPDNLPVLLQYRVNHLSAEKRAGIENQVGLAKTGWLDTHPTPADRVRRARQLGDEGAFEGDGPATEIFENFDTLSRLVTLAHYEDDLNVPTAPEFLIPLEKLIRGAEQPPTLPAPLPVPKMTYDPSAFRKADEQA